MMDDHWFRIIGFVLMFIVAPATWVSLWALMRCVVNSYPKPIIRTRNTDDR